MRNSTPTTGLFKRALVGVGAATALVGASVLGMSGIAGADGVADLPMTDLGSANLGFDSGTINQPGALDQVITQAAGGGGMVGGCSLEIRGGLYGSLFGDGPNPDNPACADTGILGNGAGSGPIPDWVEWYDGLDKLGGFGSII